MSNHKLNSWSQSEVSKLLSLQKLYPNTSNTDLASKLNAYYNNGRTNSSISKKLHSLNKTYYDEQMDTIIIKHIREYPTNLQYAFQMAAIELNKLFSNRLIKELTQQHISGRYYGVVRDKYDVIAIGSSKGFSINVKNSHVLKHPKRVNSRPKQHLKPVLWLMKEILKLSDKDRLELIRFLNN